MKTKEQILKDKFGITPLTKHHNYDYLYQSILKAMDLYQQQAHSDTEADGIVFCGKCGQKNGL